MIWRGRKRLSLVFVYWKGKQRHLEIERQRTDSHGTVNTEQNQENQKERVRLNSSLKIGEQYAKYCFKEYKKRDIFRVVQSVLRKKNKTAFSENRARGTQL